jgi:hypothetical protein
MKQKYSGNIMADMEDQERENCCPDCGACGGEHLDNCERNIFDLDDMANDLLEGQRHDRLRDMAEKKRERRTEDE